MDSQASELSSMTNSPFFPPRPRQERSEEGVERTGERQRSEIRRTLFSSQNVQSPIGNAAAFDDDDDDFDLDEFGPGSNINHLEI